MRYSRRRRANPAVDVIRVAVTVIVAILLIHIALVILEANPANHLVSTVSDWAGWLSNWSKDLFTPANYKARILVNEGLAAVVYSVVGGLVARAVARM